MRITCWPISSTASYFPHVIGHYPALQAYEAQRVKRANAITQQSLRLGQVGQWENRWAVAARDSIFRALPASMLGRSLETALEPA